MIHVIQSSCKRDGCTPWTRDGQGRTKKFKQGNAMYNKVRILASALIVVGFGVGRLQVQRVCRV